MTHSTNCKNCDAAISDNFCAHCGQKTDTHRVTIQHFIHEFFHAFTHTDKGILLLMKELITRPGYVASEYLDGKRKKYFSPLTFLVILASIYAYIAHHSGYFDALTQINQYSGKGSGTYKEAMGIMDQSGKVVSLFLMPVLISFFSWFFYIGSKRNLAENLVLNSFVLGQIYLMAIIIFIPAYLLFPGVPIFINNIAFHILMVSYLVAAYNQFYKGEIILLTAIKTIVINVFFIFFFWIIIFGYVIVKNVILDSI